MKISDILEYLNEIAPFGTAMSYDNVGLITGGRDDEITAVCCCVDITRPVIKEAAEKNANLIISHHPVIFNGMKTIPQWSPVKTLIEKNIAAAAFHTNFDVAEKGVNDTLIELLELEKSGPLGCVDGAENYGAITEAPFAFTPQTLAEHCKTKLRIDGVRYSRAGQPFSRIAVCCGAGVDGEVLELAAQKGCGAIVSGDIKHNYWIEAQNRGITLIDAGHFGTELCFSFRMAELITRKFPQIPVFASENEADPCGYV